MNKISFFPYFLFKYSKQLVMLYLPLKNKLFFQFFQKNFSKKKILVKKKFMVKNVCIIF